MLVRSFIHVFWIVIFTQHVYLKFFIWRHLLVSLSFCFSVFCDNVNGFTHAHEITILFQFYMEWMISTYIQILKLGPSISQRLHCLHDIWIISFWVTILFNIDKRDRCSDVARESSATGSSRCYQQSNTFIHLRHPITTTILALKQVNFPLHNHFIPDENILQKGHRLKSTATSFVCHDPEVN